MSDTLGLVVMLRNGEDIMLAGRRLHDETTIHESVDRARQLIAREPDIFDPATEVVIGEVTIREAK